MARSAWMRVAGWVVALASVARAEEPAAAEAVKQLDAAMAGVLRDAQALGYQGRFARLAPAVAAAFDLDFMAEKSLGRHWKTLAEGDRRRWLELFGEFTVANYAANLDHYSGQRFELLGEEPGASGTRIVRTRVVDPAGETVELVYRLHETGARWRIVDVFLKGTVSELALRRSDYSSVLERQGFEALVTTMRGKIADLAAGRAKRQGS